MQFNILRVHMNWWLRCGFKPHLFLNVSNSIDTRTKTHQFDEKTPGANKWCVFVMALEMVTLSHSPEALEVNKGSCNVMGIFSQQF